jgi:hypothetical protein
MNSPRIRALLEDAADHAEGGRGSVIVRARLALAHKALDDDRRGDLAEHLRIAYELAREDAVATPIGNARQLLSETVEGGASA